MDPGLPVFIMANSILQQRAAKLPWFHIVKYQSTITTSPLFFVISDENFSMAIQTGIFPFSGKLGQVIGYRRNGIHYLRSMPATVRQTTATRKAAREFGVASRKGKLIRRAITPHLNINRDGSLVNRLNKALISNKNIVGFRLNKYTGIEQFFSQPPFIAADGTLKIPPQVLPVQGTATQLEIKIIATRVSFLERKVTNSVTMNVMMEIGTPQDGASFPVNIPGKGTLIVVLQVSAYTGEMAPGNRRFMAADIVHVAAPAKTKHIQEPQKLFSYPLPLNNGKRGNREIARAVAALQRE
jgi:hypothetical protein